MSRPIVPFALPVNLVVSVSGGETSMMMAHWLRENAPQHYRLVFLFANTGEEREETLKFINRCSVEWRMPIVWLEAVVHKGKKACTHKVVSFKKALRKGEPFEKMLAKYAISNNSYPHCTRELKLNPILHYMKKHHLKNAWRGVGIREDENHRKAIGATNNKIVYPFIDWVRITKKDVKKFWSSQTFNLGLDEHEGNCKWCWKKSDRKLFTLIQDRPDDFIFPANMEKKYGMLRPREDGSPQVFYRKHRNTKDMINQATNEKFTRFTEPDWSYDDELDLGGSCGDTECEPFLIE